jgi:chromosome segregation ATPase
VAATLDAHLQSAGLSRCDEPLEGLPGDALVVYAPPDGLLGAGLESLTDPPTPQQLLDFYKHVLALCGRHRVIASWRLEGLPAEAIRQWLVNATPPNAPVPFPTPDPLTALLTKAVLEAQPGLLEAYLDLELTAQLAGGTSDTGYRQRISQAAADSRRLLQIRWRFHQQWQASQQDKTARDALAGEVEQLRAERERLMGVEQENTLQIAHLKSGLEAEIAKGAALEAHLAQARQERDAVALERDGAARGREAVLRERDALAEETVAAVNTVAHLNQQLTAQTEALRLAREAESQLRGQAEALTRDKQQAQEAAGHLGLELQQVRTELERRVGVDQENTLQIAHLKSGLEAEIAKGSALEAHLAQARQERDAAALERDAQTEALRLARDTEGQLRGTAEALAAEKQQALEETERLGMELLQLRAELEWLVGVDQENTLQIAHLKSGLEAEITKGVALAADGARARQERDAVAEERDAVARERDAAGQARDAVVLERDVLAREKAAAVSTVAELHQQRAAQTEALRLAREAESQLRGQAEALTREKQQAQEAAGRLGLELQQVQTELERLVGVDQENTLQIAHLKSGLEAEIAKRVEIQAHLAQARQERDAVAEERDAVALERDGAARGRDAVQQERDALAEEKGAALNTVAHLNQQLAAQSEALRLAREAESQLRGTAEALTAEKQQALEEAERLGMAQLQLGAELEWLVGVDQKKTLQIEHLRSGLEKEIAKGAALEADVARAREEREAVEVERDALARGTAAAANTVAELHHQRAAQTEALRLAREAESQLRGRAEALAAEKQQALEEGERRLNQLHALQGELERRFLADQANVAQIEHLRHKIDAQTARISDLEAERHRLSSAHEAALRAKDTLAHERQRLEQEKLAEMATVADLNHQLAAQMEALSQARVAEEHQRSRTEALVGEKGQVREEARLLMMQVHHLQEELEKTFLDGQAGNQLIAAQQQQLLRAQSLLSRLLVQTTRSVMPAQSLAVEVLPSRPAGEFSPTLMKDQSHRQGWGSGLMRKLWTR